MSVCFQQKPFTEALEFQYTRICSQSGSLNVKSMPLWKYCASIFDIKSILLVEKSKYSVRKMDEKKRMCSEALHMSHCNTRNTLKFTTK